jgi:hypothetical protein
MSLELKKLYLNKRPSERPTSEEVEKAQEEYGYKDPPK